MPRPARPKIYHIVHVDRLSAITRDGYLWSDSEMVGRKSPGTTIGMNSIKARRLRELELDSRPGLFVGECVPFYFCPRSIMLYLIHCANHQELSYRGGQEPIIHLESDLFDAVEWADVNGRRWAFTLSNAGAYYFEDRADIGSLGEVDWDSVAANRWAGAAVAAHVKEGKQAEFLIERSFPWQLVTRIGVNSSAVAQRVYEVLQAARHRPVVEIRHNWYY
ncbi:MAG TPA: DUF4433 domain-containing protein [Candidatus Elarobacter sp.]|jgi:hypothetical protein|nr:DUF4433 domain-containing protein [Candidatus Elarobacter sp.]